MAVEWISCNKRIWIMNLDISKWNIPFVAFQRLPPKTRNINWNDKICEWRCLFGIGAWHWCVWSIWIVHDLIDWRDECVIGLRRMRNGNSIKCQKWLFEAFSLRVSATAIFKVIMKIWTFINQNLRKQWGDVDAPTNEIKMNEIFVTALLPLIHSCAKNTNRRTNRKEKSKKSFQFYVFENFRLYVVQSACTTTDCERSK